MHRLVAKIRGESESLAVQTLITRGKRSKKVETHATRRRLTKTLLRHGSLFPIFMERYEIFRPMHHVENEAENDDLLQGERLRGDGCSTYHAHVR